MKQQELFDFAKKEYETCLSIMKKKNNDYSHGDDDALRNFKAISRVGLDPKWAFLNHLTTKITRIGNLLQYESKVKDESIEDTLRDLANYSILLMAYLKDTKK